MKIDSSFLYTKKITRRITINTKLRNTICTTLRKMAKHLRCSTFPPSSLYSAICKRDRRKLKHATATISLPNHFGIPWLFSVSSRTMSSISTASNKSMVTWMVSLKANYRWSSVPLKSEAMFGKKRKRTGVRHKVTFKALGPRNFSLSRSSPATANIMAMMGIKKTTR